MCSCPAVKSKIVNINIPQSLCIIRWRYGLIEKQREFKILTMKKAIKILEKRIQQLNEKFKEAERIADEPEMLADYEFARNDMANIEMEIIEMQSAIKILNDCFVPQPKQEVFNMIIQLSDDDQFDLEMQLAHHLEEKLKIL